MKDATAPKTTPIKRDPTASGMGEFKCVAAAIQLPATITPSTAAKSSISTTLTLGSCPRLTVR